MPPRFSLAKEASRLPSAPPPLEGLQRLERLVSLLDDRFVVPGTRLRVGLDGLLGMLPVVGDTATMLTALYVVFEAKRLGAPAGLIARMLVNVGIDGVAGSVPLLGDLFDFAFKANRRNIRLLRRHLERQHRAAAGDVKASR